MLQLEVKDVARAVEATKKLLPIIPGVDVDIARLKQQLLQARQEAEELSLQLESPANLDRSVMPLLWWAHMVPYTNWRHMHSIRWYHASVTAAIV